MAVTDRANRAAEEGAFYYPRWRDIPHYYGDIVRMLFLAAAILMLVGAPFYTDDLKTQLPFIVIGAIVLVALAALTSPRSPLVMRLNAGAAGAGVVIYEIWALWGYGISTAIDFALRQIPAVIFIFAFYFALKTLRAMLMGMVGGTTDALSGVDEAREIAPPDEKSALERPELAYDEHMEPTDDGLGRVPAQEDDSGGD